MRRTWILVAENSRAKFFSAEDPTAPISEIEALICPNGRLHEGDLVSDNPGSDGGSVGQGRHVIDNKVTARDQEHINFAKQLATRLNTARKKGKYDRLVLVAPPAFLGLLRDSVSKEVSAMVSRQVDKNLVQQPAEVLRKYL